MILAVIARFLLVPLGKQQTLQVVVNIGGLLGTLAFSRMQNKKIDDIHERMESLSSSPAHIAQILADSRERPVSSLDRLMHFAVRVAPVITGKKPRELLWYIVSTLVQHGYMHTVQNVPGFLNREQQRRVGIAPNPMMALRFSSARTTFPPEARDQEDVDSGRQFNEAADIVTINVDARVIAVNGTLILYLRLLLVFLLCREIFLVVGKYLDSNNIVVLTPRKIVKRAPRKISPAKKSN